MINSYDSSNVSSSSNHIIISGKKSLLTQSKDGKGVNLCGKIVCIALTLFDYIKSRFDETSKQDVMCNFGCQLTPTKVNDYLDSLKTQNSIFDYTSAFIGTSAEFTGSTKHIESLKKILDEFVASEQRKFAIPLVLPPLHFPEEPHIVMIFVDKDTNSLEYFDSKGITSENRVLQSSEQTTMYSVLENLRQTLNKTSLNQSYTITENAKVIQMDINNCGAYVSWFAKKRLKNSATEILQKGIKDIHEFRIKMKNSMPSNTIYK